MILSIKGTTKVLIILLLGCVGWSAPVLFANSRRQFFSRQGPYKSVHGGVGGGGGIVSSICLGGELAA